MITQAPHIVAADRRFDFIDSGHAEHVIEKAGLHEHLLDASARRAYFADLPNEHFDQFVGYINAKVRGIEPTYNYEDGKMPLAATPARVHKTPLMHESFQAVRTILHDDTLDDREALLRAGLTMSGAMKMVHPFIDGNGRTSRLINYLIQYGTERGELAADEARAIIAKNPAFEGETKQVIDDGVPEGDPSLQSATSKHLKIIADKNGKEVAQLGPRVHAVAKVRAFLDAMTGTEPGILTRDERLFGATLQKGMHSFLDLYKLFYFNLSSAPEHTSGERRQRIALQLGRLTERELQSSSDGPDFV